MATNRSTFGITIGRRFVLNDVNCTGNESNIFDCQYPTGSIPNCRVSSREEAGVICGVTPGPVGIAIVSNRYFKVIIAQVLEQDVQKRI